MGDRIRPLQEAVCIGRHEHRERYLDQRRAEQRQPFAGRGIGRMIGFVGLSHLGIVSSAAAAAKGFDVVGYDADTALCVALRDAHPPIVEPGLTQLLHDVAFRIRYTADSSDLARCDVIYISVDVPTDHSNRSDVGPVSSLLRMAADVAKPGATLVVLSQVHPGFCREAKASVEPLVPKQLQLFYQVETLIFGSAIERALRPERFMVGCSHPCENLPAP